MPLQFKNIAVGNLQDDVSGNNYAANKAVYILNLNNTLAQIYSDEAGTIPIVQDGVNNVTGAKGVFGFWVEAGDYFVQVGANKYRVSITGADYFNNRVDETVDLIVDAVAGRGAYYPVGSFEAGFTYTDINQVGTFGGTDYYVYTGGLTNLPHIVTAGTDPTLSSDYAQVFYGEIDNVQGLRDELNDRALYLTIAQAKSSNIQPGQYVVLTDRGYNKYLCQSSGTPSKSTHQLNNGNYLSLVVVGGVVRLSAFTIVDSHSNDNNVAIQEASDIAKAAGLCSIEHDLEGPIKLKGAAPVIGVPITSNKAADGALFIQEDNDQSVLVIEDGLDFSEHKNFTASYANAGTQTQTAPAILAQGTNHNTKFSNIRTVGGTYGIHSDQLSFWQTYEHVRCEDFENAPLRIDGQRNDTTGGGTTIVMTNCGCYNNKTHENDAGLVVNNVSELIVNSFEVGQGVYKDGLLINNAFGADLNGLHFEANTINRSFINAANSGVKGSGLYWQGGTISTGVTVHLFRSFKSTIDWDSIFIREETINGTLNLFDGSDAYSLGLGNDFVLSLGGTLRGLPNLTAEGSYRDNNNTLQAVFFKNIDFKNAPKRLSFKVDNATPDVNLTFPFNGFKPDFMEVTLATNAENTTGDPDGAMAKITSLSGGSLSSACTYKYKWTDATGAIQNTSRTINVVCYYNGGHVTNLTY